MIFFLPTASVRKSKDNYYCPWVITKYVAIAMKQLIQCSMLYIHIWKEIEDTEQGHTHRIIDVKVRWEHCNIVWPPAEYKHWTSSFNACMKPNNWRLNKKNIQNGVRPTVEL